MHTGHADNGFLAGEISHVLQRVSWDRGQCPITYHEGVVEGGIDVGDSKDELTRADIGGPERLLLLDGTFLRLFRGLRVI